MDSKDSQFMFKTDGTKTLGIKRAKNMETSFFCDKILVNIILNMTLRF